MIFKIYICTIIFYWIAFIVVMIDVFWRIKKRGLKKKAEIIYPFPLRVLFKAMIIGAIPVVNTFFGFMFIFSESVVENTIKDMTVTNDERL